VLLVDRRPVMREGLRSVIEHEPDLVVVGQAPTVRDARSLDVTPDVIVTDIDLPDARYGAVVSGLRASFGQSSILVFSPIIDPVEVQSILAAGAHGYLSETAGTPDLCTGIRTVAVGETYLHPVLGVALARLRHASDTPPGLSPQEKRVLRLLVLGHTNGDVARLCNISIRTAQTHRAHIQHKLDRSTRAELVEYAREHGIIRIDPQ
jgi:two-component system, NarL family, response regulator NreC